MSTLDDSAQEYDRRIARWAARLAAATLTADQAEGVACVACDRNWLTNPDPSIPSVPIGFGPRGGQVFVCRPCDEAQLPLVDGASQAQGIAESVPALDPENSGTYTGLIADRIGASIAQSGRDKDKVAVDAGMTADQLDRSLRHERGLYVHEAVFLAEAIGCSLFSLLVDTSERGGALLLGDADRPTEQGPVIEAAELAAYIARLPGGDAGKLADQDLRADNVTFRRGDRIQVKESGEHGTVKALAARSIVVAIDDVADNSFFQSADVELADDINPQNDGPSLCAVCDHFDFVHDAMPADHEYAAKGSGQLGGAE